MRHGPLKAGQIIIATAVLNNFAASEGDIWINKGQVICADEHDPRDNYHYGNQRNAPMVLDGKRVRRDIVETHFA